MKHFLRNFLSAAAVVLFAVSCDKNDGIAEEQTLPVTYINIEGTWELVEWNGEPLAEGTYAYIELTRQGEFSSYSNIESTALVTTAMTGTYDIDQDDDTVGGNYDYLDYEPWAHRYVVSGLTATSMTWTADDDASEVRVYSRIDSIPEGIVTPGNDDAE